VTEQRRPSLIARRGQAILIALIPGVVLYLWSALEELHLWSTDGEVRRVIARASIIGYLLLIGLLALSELPRTERPLRRAWVLLWTLLTLWATTYISPLGLQRTAGTVHHNAYLSNGVFLASCADFSPRFNTTPVPWFPGWDNWRLDPRMRLAVPAWPPVQSRALLQPLPGVRHVSVSLLLPTAAAAILFATVGLRARRRSRQRHRLSAGLCPRCGYDLRESPAQCPECGLTKSRPSRLGPETSISDN
jgi:hypothetical protein